ncbi:hypothetical protein GCM10027515_33440 [Schumannella luteola]|uniref:LPXTG cell wall anchor domain-containing protein n=1 Tax=Schumannella luteola TaxID=472059 RepID=A0A852YDV3_9MICO|nr:hypothetical protein [Schumannella luteola]NYH00704.1 hypothetical protein [Schumannella luteola]TPX01557.1 hypothetical protein FJ656_26965 [Schumannella luteola]
MNRSLRALLGVSLTAALVTSPLVATGALAETAEGSGSAAQTPAESESNVDVTADPAAKSESSAGGASGAGSPSGAGGAAVAADPAEKPEAPQQVYAGFGSDRPSTALAVGWELAAAPASFRVTVTRAGSPAVLATQDFSEPAQSDDGFFAEETVELPAAWAYGDEFSVTVNTIGSDGETLSDPSTVTAYAPITASPVIVSTSSTNFHDPTVVVKWSYSTPRPETHAGWYVSLTQQDPGADSESVYAVDYQIGAASRFFSFSEINRYHADGRVERGLSIPNGMTFDVRVYPYSNGPAPIGETAEGQITTSAIQTPPAPAQPTGDTYGVTAKVSGSTLTAYVPAASPGSWVFGYAFSTPTGLGWAQVSADRTATFSLAGAGLAPGVHHLAVLDNTGWGIGSVAFSVGTAGGSTGPTRLAETGTEADLPLSTAIALLIAGAALITVRRLRDARSARTEA